MGRTQAAAIAMRVGVVGMVKFPSLAGVLLAIFLIWIVSGDTGMPRITVFCKVSGQ